MIQYADSTATMVSYEHTMVYAGNGKKSYRMYAPQIRRYEYACEPYTVYPEGVRVDCYSDTVSGKVIADLRADYAVLWENSKMWEARGHVVGNNYLEDKHMETDILFWDQENGLIYNDHRTKVKDGGNTWTGYGFQTDEGFEVWRFNHSKGYMRVSRNMQEDTVQQDSVKVDVPQAQPENEEIFWDGEEVM